MQNNLFTNAVTLALKKWSMKKIKKNDDLINTNVNFLYRLNTYQKLAMVRMEEMMRLRK